MLFLSLVYDVYEDYISSEISRMKNLLESRGIMVGISESIDKNVHFLKLYSGEELTLKAQSTINIYIANILYGVAMEEFANKELSSFLTDSYFFLKFDELKDIRERTIKVLTQEGPILDENMVYCINRKNNMKKKIIACLEENDEINIRGFITFRIKDLKEDIECILDKVVEAFMVEKEYSEFIKLLKYFVEIQESKIEEVNIFVKADGTYIIKDDKGEDILGKLTSDLSEARFSSTVSIEDMLISGLITNSPGRIVIHCADNCLNKELLETIKNVFCERVSYCSSCKTCDNLKQNSKI